ncbi:substrate-binding periplasmic protein [Rubrivivax sp. RP6-9]|uniref:substrate-binding periplasmic protein n=1 Tax=Rubrivivax sp. RP6-9 TaxID=3415750 RepID=UPI003CC52018
MLHLLFLLRRPVRAAAVVAVAVAAALPVAATERPDCTRPLTLGLHEHGLLYSAETGQGIDRDLADELAQRSGCRITTTLLPRARIWQLVESGALDFSLSGISNPARERFAAFAWTFTNKYYLLVHKDAGVQSPAEFLARPELKLGAIRSYRYSASANRLVDALEAQRRVSYASALDPLYEVLLDGQLQAMIIEPFDYPTLQNARIRAQTQILEFDDPPVPHGLIMSRKALPPAQLEAWRALVDGMRADGTVQRIFEKYFKPDLAREMTRF